MPPTTATHLTAQRLESLDAYWRFHRAVAAAQRSRWLPRRPSRLLDLAGVASASAKQAAAAGHTVLAPHEDQPSPAGPALRVADAGRIIPVRAEGAALSWLRDASVDAVVADDGTLSRHLVAELLAGEVARVLKPGGRVIASVDSQLLGMGMLAGQQSWAQLSDVPSAEVLLVPWPDGRISRCFGVAQVRELFSGAGLEVEWVRPRTMLAPMTVQRVLRQRPGALRRLVHAELTASRTDEALGIHHVISARRPE